MLSKILGDYYLSDKTRIFDLFISKSSPGIKMDFIIKTCK